MSFSFTLTSLIILQSPSHMSQVCVCVWNRVYNVGWEYIYCGTTMDSTFDIGPMTMPTFKTLPKGSWKGYKSIEGREVMFRMYGPATIQLFISGLCLFSKFGTIGNWLLELHLCILIHIHICKPTSFIIHIHGYIFMRSRICIAIHIHRGV